MDKQKIPIFQTIAEEAAFWDAHDTTQFEDEFEEVDVEFQSPLIPRGLRIDLQEPYLSQIIQLARQMGRQPDKLVTDWVIERLQQTAV